jgi:tRNA threonylcarbamoyladenosine biosynthesis protein TsaB
MKLLAVDTATRSCSVAVVQGRALLSELTIDNGQTHTKHLNLLIRQAVELAGISIADLDGFVVTKGPGSFTGLRIGLSTVKGLAAAYGRPIVGVSTLETLARQAGVVDRLICPLVDARRGEVYFSGYRYENCELRQQSAEQAVAPDKMLGELKEPCFFIGNGSAVYRQDIIDRLQDRAQFATPGLNTIRAATVALLGYRRIAAGEGDEIDSMVPTYLRKSDAELPRQPH